MWSSSMWEDWICLMDGWQLWPPSRNHPNQLKHMIYLFAHLLFFLYFLVKLQLQVMFLKLSVFNFYRELTSTTTALQLLQFRYVTLYVFSGIHVRWSIISEFVSSALCFALLFNSSRVLWMSFVSKKWWDHNTFEGMCELWIYNTRLWVKKQKRSTWESPILSGGRKNHIS